jgi:hypothetical protein
MATIPSRGSLAAWTYVVALSLSFASSTAGAAVWVTKNTWSEHWESKFADWVEKQWHPEVYSNPASPYVGHETDCADACYDMRVVFAYEQGLPFVVNARSGDGSRISNEMRTWDHLPQESRLKAFLAYLHDRTSSETIADDTYPIAMNRENFKPGLIYLQPKSHCFQVIKISEYGVPSTLSSTVPRVARELYLEQNFPAFVPADNRGYRDGYRRFRWPEHIGLPVNQVPGFSDEQYRLAESKGNHYISFTDSLLERFGSRREPAPMRAQRFMYNLCYYARQRVEIVQGALDHLGRVQSSGRQCLTPSEYYDHSTDSRDRRLKDYFLFVRELIGSDTWRDPDWTNNDYRAEWYLKPYAEAIFRGGEESESSLKSAKGRGGAESAVQDPPTASVFGERWPLFNSFSASRRKTQDVTDADLIAWCGIEYKPGIRISLRDVWQGISRGTLSSDPHASREHRWGLIDAAYQPRCRQY